jgi:hypothetical protein
MGTPKADHGVGRSKCSFSCHRHSTGKQSATIGTHFGGSLDEKLEAAAKSVKLPSVD